MLRRQRRGQRMTPTEAVENGYITWIVVTGKRTRVIVHAATAPEARRAAESAGHRVADVRQLSKVHEKGRTGEYVLTERVFRAVEG